MLPSEGSFEFDYFGSEMVYGRGSVDRLDQLLADRELSDALIVCGSNVGSNEAVMDPLRRGLDDRLAGVFDETTPAKTIDTVYDGIEAMNRIEPDVLIGLGGGSSLDIARQMSAFAADGRPLSAFRDAARDGRVESAEPSEPTTPVIVVPTTFAGADVSSGGAVEVLSPSESPTDRAIRAGGSVRPKAMVYDPDLFETTPLSALAGSAMNGFDKGIETIYAADATPITDATASRGLRALRDAFPKLDERDDDPRVMERTVIGIVLVQFRRKGSIVHAFGHGFTQRYPVQQGVIHAIVVPHVLRYLFERIDGRREVLAEALGIDADSLSDDEVADAIVDEVVAVRDSFELPTRLREVDAVETEDIPAIADAILDDYLMANVPAELEPSSAEIESVLRDAW